MPTKRTTVWEIERTDWFGGAEVVESGFETQKEATAKAAEYRRHSRNCDDPADKVMYTVHAIVWERDV